MSTTTALPSAPAAGLAPDATEAPGEAAPLLRAEGVYLGFGGIQALAGVSLGVMPGEITAVIGPNGAGKTSLFNTLSGFYRPQRGRILLDGRDLTGVRPDRRAGTLGAQQTAFGQIAQSNQHTALLPAEKLE